METVWQAIVEFLTQVWRVVLPALRATAGQTLPVAAPLLLLGWFIHLLAVDLENNAISLLGVRAYLILLGWPGTLVHELGHAMFCPLFGHRITGMKLFSLKPGGQDTGYVSHTFNQRNPWHLAGNFFISVGPVLLGALVVYLLLRFLAAFPLQLAPIYSAGKSLSPEGTLAQGLLGWLWMFWKSSRYLALSIHRSLDFTDWRLYLAAWLVLGVGSGMALSAIDIKLAAGGLAVTLSLVFLVNVVLVLMNAKAPSVQPVIPPAVVLAFLMLGVFCACAAGALIFRLLRFVFRR